METRILELALETLEKRRAAIDSEIANVQAALKGMRVATMAGLIPPPSGRRRPKSAAEKKALSLKMKRIWAEKRAQAGKTKKATFTGPKRRSKTIAQKKALSVSMKKAWAKRKAEAAQKSK